MLGMVWKRPGTEWNYRLICSIQKGVVRRRGMNWRWSPAAAAGRTEVFVRHEEGGGTRRGYNRILRNLQFIYRVHVNTAALQIHAADLLQIVPCCFDNPYYRYLQ